MKRVLGAIVAIAATVLIVALSHVDLPDHASADAMVRISWSARPERVEVCHRLDDEEYAKLPAHMRRRVVCDGTTARYELQILRDFVVVATDTVRGGGLRHDRELYALRDIRVPAGRSRIGVRFARIDSSQTADALLRADTSESADASSRAAREDAERDRRRAEAIPPLLVLDTVVLLAPRKVLLVTYGDASRRLVVRTSP